MKKLKAMIALLLCAALLFGCSNDQSHTELSTDASNEATYRVTVTDAEGNPAGANVIVNFISNGTTVAMQTVDSNGVAEKVLPKGEYTVELSFVDNSASYHYDQNGLTLTAENTSLNIILSKAMQEYTGISAYSAVTDAYKEYSAGYVGTGITYVSLDTADRTFVLFVPTEGGIYRFSLVGGNGQIGYYGSQHYVQNASLGEHDTDGSFTVSVSNSMIGTDGTGTATLVIGIDGDGSESCYLSIQRIGDPVLSIEDYPWDIYSTTAALSAYSLPSNVKLADFDLTAASGTYQFIYNAADGYYHLNTADGPVIYCRLGTSSKYLDSIQTILESSGFSSYFFDEDGSFVRKESYTECLFEYIAVMDPIAGVYPLTSDLVYIIQSRGEYVGWWDISGSSYLFCDGDGNPIPGINKDTAWLFLCCYGEVEQSAEKPDDGNSAQPTDPKPTDPEPTDPEPTDPDPTDPEPTDPEPTDPEPTDPEPERVVGTVSADDPVEMGMLEHFTATVNGGEYAKYIFYRIMGTIDMYVHSDYAYVIYNNTVYWAEDGVVHVQLKGGSMSSAITLYIGNIAGDTATFDVYMQNPKGTQLNPYELAIGSNSVDLEAGNEIGAYFKTEITQSGTITLTIDSVTENVSGQIVINVTTSSYVTVQYTLSDTGSVTFDVGVGDTLEIIVCCSDPADPYTHPAGSVKFSLSY